LIDANKLEKSIQLSIESWCRDFNINAPVIVRTYKDVLSRIGYAPTVDAVELPKGKPGDYLEWDNGTGFKQIYCISAVMICEDCVRYDLEKFTPEVNHKNIVRIMSREQAVKEYRDRCTRERTEEEPTFTAVKGERKDNDL
jgi:hypothetical protein